MKKTMTTYNDEYGQFGTGHQPISGEEVYSVSPNNLKLHKLANEHPRMTDIESQRLKESISEIGQMEPVLIYRNKIVDGRHRFWAIEALGLPEIKCKVLPSYMTIKEVREIVFGSEVRRHQTGTQKAIKAWRAIQENGLSYREAEIKFMTSRNMISACKYIAERKGTDMIDKLYDGKSVAIGLRTSSSLTMVKKLIKEEEDAELKERLDPRKEMSDDEIKDKSEKYINSLASEDIQTVEYVAKAAFRMMKERK